MGFTARQLDSLKAKDTKPEEHFEPDPDYRGLAIRVAPSGRRLGRFTSRSQSAVAEWTLAPIQPRR
jgi:hypothetical protein